MAVKFHFKFSFKNEVSEEQQHPSQEEPDPFEFETEGEDGTPGRLRPRPLRETSEPFKILAAATSVSSER